MSMIRRILLTAALLILLALLAAPGHAQVKTPTPNDIDAIAKELWCPLCNGVRLDNCELQACIQMREVIAQKLMGGEGKEQIKAYFVEQYGDVVLGAPAAVGFNRIVWLLPVLIAAVAVGWLTYLISAWTRRRSPVSVAAASSGSKPASTDEYLRRVDEQLEREE